MSTVTCGQCVDGLVDVADVADVNRCTCGSPADESVNYMHERHCGTEPCPNGCWWALNPDAPGRYARKPRRVLLAERARRASPLRRWRLRASRWHPGEPHNEVTCSYEEWLAAQPLWYRRLPAGQRERGKT